MDLRIISQKIKKEIVFTEPYIKTPYHDNIKVVFADYTASGRPSPIIEDYIRDSVLPYYSNTHSNAYLGIKMKNMVKKTKDYMREVMNIDECKKIIFTGNGTTGAVNHLLFCLKLNELKKVNVYLTPEEHHSNYLPWVELAKKYKNIHINILLTKDNFDLDLVDLDKKLGSDQDSINIVSITACSNVLGIKLDVKKIYDMIQKYNVCDNQKCCFGKKNLLFVDYACSGPYDKIDGSISDAFVFSPHKFLGGHSTPGVLVAGRELFQNNVPLFPGGNCVEKVCSNQIKYAEDIEKKETAGTPNIVGIIRIKKILQLKEMLFKYIEHNEKEISKYVFCQFKQMMDTHKDLQVILPECHVDNRLPIVCFAIEDVHYNLVVALLNDFFGIQTRGGVSCTGLLSELIEKKYGMKGWCRISFNWIMDKKEIDYIIDGVKFVLENVDKYKDKYKHDRKSNLFTHIKNL